MDPYPLISQLIANPINYGELAIYLSLISMLLYISGLISASELAFFSLSPQENLEIENSDSPNDKRIKELLSNPEHLLGTILISNYIANIAIIILCILCTNNFLNLSLSPNFGLLIQIGIITFLLLLFGEIMPKIHATQNPLKLSRRSASILTILNITLKPISKLFVGTTKIIDRQISRRKSNNISMNEISQALEIAAPSLNDEKDILKGIATFGTITADKIMTSRTDMIMLNSKMSYNEVIDCITKNEYSRIPVYADSFDNIRGVLYAKDLIPHLNKNNNFKWQTLIRSPYFVPETIKIDDLLQHFQRDRTHIAIVVDEFGGTSGLVTMEDILEEVVGDISDEYDNEDLLFSKIDNYNYTFEAKIPLSDLIKALNLDTSFFDNMSVDIDTLAGLLLEIKGEIPPKGTIIQYKNFIFEITEADNRRIKRVKLSIQ